MGIVVALLCFLACASSAQVPGKIDMVVPQAGDTIFMMDKRYAEYVASKFDSLDVFRNISKHCLSALDTAHASLETKNKLVASLKEESAANVEKIKLLDLKYMSLEGDYTETRKANIKLDNMLSDSEHKKKRAQRWSYALGGVSTAAIITAVVVGIVKK